MMKDLQQEDGDGNWNEDDDNDDKNEVGFN